MHSSLTANIAPVVGVVLNLPADRSVGSELLGVEKY